MHTLQPSDIERDRSTSQEPTSHFAVRAGVHGSIFRMTSSEAVQRGQRVVCRTARGLEIGRILAPLQTPAASASEVTGKILRRMTTEDTMLWSHLEALASEAHTECVALLQENQEPATLLAVEPLLDGKTLYFHFLDTSPSDVEKIIGPLIEKYQNTVSQSLFARLVEHGCGPGCGTEKASRGCGSSVGCVVCKAASACSTRVQH